MEITLKNDYKDYEAFKLQLDKEFHQAAEGFVRIGYLLKIARDTDILYQSGYGSVTEFAMEEYGLRKDEVSRFIAINDKYSVNGYSEELQDRYKGYGRAKLQEMLTLPQEVIDEIPLEITRKELQEIKKDIRQEEQITDIEVMLEEEEEELENSIEKVLYTYMKENMEIFKGIHGMCSNGTLTERGTMEVLAPSGVASRMVHVPGEGGLMFTITGLDKNITILNVRNGEKEEYTWQQLVSAVAFLLSGAEQMTCSQAYEKIYKVAPVQQKKREEKKEKEKKTVPEEKKERQQEKTEEKKEEPEIIPEEDCEVVDTEDRKELEHKMTEVFYNRYQERLYGTTKLRLEIADILDKVHKNIYTFDYNGHRYRITEHAGTLELKDENGTIQKYDQWKIADMVDVYRSNQIPGQDNIMNHAEYLPEEMKSERKREMEHCVRNSISNLSVSVEKKAWKAALADAGNVVHYLEKVLEMEEENE